MQYSAGGFAIPPKEKNPAMIDLYTWTTPNGRKVSVMLEECSLPYRTHKIDIGKEAVTHYEVAERFRGYTLVKLSPKTGRTHQLRVHMSFLGHPVAGDTMYGGRPVSEGRIAGTAADEPFLRHQALHAWKIRFKHPIHETPQEVEAPFHADLKRLVLLLRKYRAK